MQQPQPPRLPTLLPPPTLAPAGARPRYCRPEAAWPSLRGSLRAPHRVHDSIVSPFPPAGLIRTGAKGKTSRFAPLRRCARLSRRTGRCDGCISCAQEKLWTGYLGHSDMSQVSTKVPTEPRQLQARLGLTHIEDADQSACCDLHSFTVRRGHLGRRLLGAPAAQPGIARSPWARG